MVFLCKKNEKGGITINLFELFGTISLKDEGFTSGIDKAKGAFSSVIDKTKSAFGTINGVADKVVGTIMDFGAKAGTALLDLGTSAVKLGMDYEEQMSKVGAISGASVDDMELLGDKAKEMGAKTKFSATESAQAFEYMAMAGWKTEDMLNGIEGIMNLAAASGEDLALTSDIVTDALTAFGLTASDSGKFADLLAAASSNANTNVAMMGETFKYIAPVAGALGYSAEDSALAIGLMANSGIKASQAGTSLRAALSAMVKPTEGAFATMQELGISLFKSSEEIEKTAENSINYSQRMDELTVSLEKGEIKTKEFEKASKELNEERDNAISQMQGEIGEQRTLNELMINLRESMGGLSETQQAQAAATLFGREAMSGMLAIVNASEEDFNKLSGAIENSEGEAERMAETMQDNLSGQITLLNSGLEGLAIQFYESVDTPLKDVVKKATSYVEELSTAFSEGGLGGMVAKVGDIIADVAVNLAEKAPEFIEIAISLIDNLVEGLTSNSDKILDGAMTAFNAIIDGINEIFPKLVPLALEILQAFVSGFISYKELIFTTGVEILTELIQGVAEMLPELIPQAISAINNIINTLAENLPLILEAGIDIILQLVDGIVSMLPELIPLAVDIIITIIDTLMDNLGDIIEAGLDILVALIEGIAAAIPELVSFLPIIIGEIVGVLIAELPNIIAAGYEIIFALVDGLLQSMPELVAATPKLIIAIVGTIVENLDTFVEGAVKIVGAIIVGLIQSIPDIIMAVPQIISSIVETFGKYDWGSIGKNIIEGLKKGISDAAGKVVETVKNVASSIYNAVTGFFQISSPSKLFRDKIGKMIPEGLAEGIDKNADKATKAAEEMSKTIMDVASEDFDIEYGVNLTPQKNHSAADGYITNYIPSASNTETALQAGNQAMPTIINNFNMENIIIREEADIRKIASQLQELQKREWRGIGVLA